jgi:hypothetical protein
MGAFMALPIAALITSFITHYRNPRDVVYHTKYEGDYYQDTDLFEAGDGADDEPESNGGSDTEGAGQSTSG